MAQTNAEAQPETETARFDEKSALLKFLGNTNPNVIRSVVGRAFSKHCGERRLKIREFQVKSYQDGHIDIQPLDRYFLYCVKDGSIEEKGYDPHPGL